MNNCIYRFLNAFGRVIYIGKAKDLNQRMSNHCHLPSECYEETVLIEYCTFDSEYDMDLAERYFIPKYNPKYNTVLYGKEITLSIFEFDHKDWFVFSKGKPVKAERECEYSPLNEEVNIDDVIKEKIELAKNIFLEKLNTPVVVCLTGETFKNIYEASVEFGLDINSIVESCDGVIGAICDNHPMYGCHLSFRYQPDYNRENMANYIEKYTRRVVCITTNEEFINIEEAQEKYNITNVKGCCKGWANYCGASDNTPLVWMWKDQYDISNAEHINKKLSTAYDIYSKKKKKIA